MKSEPISVDEFKKRLTVLCAGGGSGFPRKQRDRHILLRSVAQTLATGSYTERDLNDTLRAWLAGIGDAVELDHVTLRRYLVDAGYVSRDRTGSRYEACLGGGGGASFDPEINAVDLSSLIRDARERAERRKRDRVR